MEPPKAQPPQAQPPEAQIEGESPAKKARVKIYSSARALFVLCLVLPCFLILLSGLPRSFDEVVEWAHDDVGLDTDNAEKLRHQQIDGDALRKMTFDDFRNSGILIGPSIKLVDGVRELFSVTPGPSLFYPLTSFLNSSI